MATWVLKSRRKINRGAISVGLQPMPGVRADCLAMKVVTPINARPGINIIYRFAHTVERTAPEDEVDETV